MQSIKVQVGEVNMAEAFIKLYKKLLEWEWYDDGNTFRLFIHCLLKANWKPTSWHGLNLHPGQFITSLPSLAEETHLSIKEVRTALNHLKSTGEVADKTFNKFRIITVNNWDEYQAKGRQGADKGQTEGRQGATDKEYKEIKEYKNITTLKSNKKIHNYPEREIDYSGLEQEMLGD